MLACAAALAGCDAGHPPQDTKLPVSAPAAQAGSNGPATASAAENAKPGAPPAPAGVPALAPVAVRPSTDARLDGFGPLRLGMTAREAAAAWPGLFARDAGAGARRTCFHVDVGLPGFTLMFDDGRFVRYDSGNDALVAPGGGGRGMSEAELQRLYHGSLQASPHRFARGGKYLSFDTSGVAPSRLVFETDAAGVTGEWRVGLHPQVDYAEACESDD